MTSGHPWAADFSRTQRNVGSLVVCAFVELMGTESTAGCYDWCEQAEMRSLERSDLCHAPGSADAGPCPSTVASLSAKRYFCVRRRRDGQHRESHRGSKCQAEAGSDDFVTVDYTCARWCPVSALGGKSDVAEKIDCKDCALREQFVPCLLLRGCHVACSV